MDDDDNMSPEAMTNSTYQRFAPFTDDVMINVGALDSQDVLDYSPEQDEHSSFSSSEETQDKLYHAGANFIVRPDALGGMFMAHMITKPIVIEFLNLINGASGLDYHLEEIDYTELRDEFKDKTSD